MGRGRGDSSGLVTSAAMSSAKHRGADETLPSDSELAAVVAGGRGRRSLRHAAGRRTESLHAEDRRDRRPRRRRRLDPRTTGRRREDHGLRPRRVPRRGSRGVVLREAAERIGGDLVGRATRIEGEILTVLAEWRPDQRIVTNVESWAGVVLELVGLPRAMFTPRSRSVAPSAGPRTSWNSTPKARSWAPVPAASAPNYPRPARPDDDTDYTALMQSHPGAQPPAVFTGSMEP